MTIKEAVKDAIKNVQRGRTVTYSLLAYWQVREALQDYAAKCLDEGQDMYAQIALAEVKNLDRIHGR